jgi:hypothetical protein
MTETKAENLVKRACVPPRYSVGVGMGGDLELKITETLFISTVPPVAYSILVRGLLKVVLEIVTRDKIRTKY